MITANNDLKCVVWDLDDTIWKGILLESEKVELRTGIEKIIQTLDERGILHSIASKNNYDDAMAKLKHFNLDQYFIYPEINWNAKSASIDRIRKNINIGMDTILFIDDQAFERDEVKNAHPEVNCVDASDYEALIKSPYLYPRFITADSKKRREMYMSDIRRNKMEDEFEGPKESFLASLGMEFEIATAQEEDLKRAEELTVRTHQLNATGVTYSYDELNAFRKSDLYKLYVCELKDKYGTYGKIGLSLAEVTDEFWYLKLLLMSCRVMARGVGTVMMSHVMNEAKKDSKKLFADFKRTDRNRMMFVSYKFANFNLVSEDSDGNILLENDLSVIQDFPPYIKMTIKP